MRYRIVHTTKYAGSEPVSVGQNQAWLRPRDLPWQRCLRYRLAVTPQPSTRVERLDYFSNHSVGFTFNGGYDALNVTAKSQVEVDARNWPAPDATAPWEDIVTQLRQPDAPETLEASQFRFDSPRAPDLLEATEYARESFPQGRPILEALLDLTARIHHDFQYRPLSTTVSTPVEEVFRQRHGVCQDFAHLELAMLRGLGLAGRYVSGYLRTIPPPGKPRLIGVDASHAWLSVYCGPAGWIDLDPTNNVIPQTDHITLAWGRDYADVPPLRGVFIGGGTHQLAVHVDVEPLDDTPRHKP